MYHSNSSPATTMDNAAVVSQRVLLPPPTLPQPKKTMPRQSRGQLELAPYLPQASVRDREGHAIAGLIVDLNEVGDGDADPLVDYYLDSYGDVLAQVAQASQQDSNSTIERVYQQNADDDAFADSVLVPEHRRQQQSVISGQQQISAATAEEQQKQRDRATVENWQVGGGGGGGGGRGAQAPEVKQLGGGGGDGGGPQATKKPKTAEKPSSRNDPTSKSNVLQNIRRFSNSYSKIFLAAQPTEYNSRRPNRDQAIAAFKVQCDKRGYGFDWDRNMPIVDSKVSMAYL